LDSLEKILFQQKIYCLAHQRVNLSLLFCGEIMSNLSIDFYTAFVSVVLMNFTQAVDYLYGLGYERDHWDLTRIDELLQRLKMPHRRMGTIIHVTGSNGKGSVCAMVANILNVSGYKVGLYTSPHLRRITERIRINGEEISKDVFALYVQEIRKHVTDQSFFEVMTALSFLCFADNNVDFSVIEVGLGGTLDATNVVDSAVSVITTISLEHTKRLGGTEEEIARDKAGIIKPGSTCVTGTDGDALRVIEEVCVDVGATLKVSKRTDFSRLGLKGDVQKENAGTAIKVIKALKKMDILIPKLHILEGLETVKWPGRLEFVEPRLLIDVAHNPAGTLQLVTELEQMKKEKHFAHIICVVGILGDKDWKAMLDELVRVVDVFILTKPNSPRAADPLSLERYLEKQFAIEPTIVENVKMALEKAKRDATKEDLIVVTGSFYTVGGIY
jgi:dihydrofolate synthase / folylpolyglutamate synthase